MKFIGIDELAQRFLSAGYDIPFFRYCQHKRSEGYIIY